MDEKLEHRRTQFSQEVMERDKRSVDAYTSTYQHAERVTSSLGKFFRDVLPDGREMPDFHLMQVMIGNVIKNDLDELLRSDEENRAEVRENSKEALIREKERKQVLKTLGGIRDTFDGRFGRGMCERYLGLGSRLPEDPVAVWKLGLRTIVAVSSPDFTLPESDRERTPGVDFYPQRWADALRPHVEALRASLVRMSEERRATQASQEDKIADLERHDLHYGRCARLLEALYEVAGHVHLAKRLRPPSRVVKAKKAGEPSDEESEDRSDDRSDDASDGASSNAALTAGKAAAAEPAALAPVERLALPAARATGS